MYKGPCHDKSSRASRTATASHCESSHCESSHRESSHGSLDSRSATMADDSGIHVHVEIPTRSSALHTFRRVAGEAPEAVCEGRARARRGRQPWRLPWTWCFISTSYSNPHNNHDHIKHQHASRESAIAEVNRMQQHGYEGSGRLNVYRFVSYDHTWQASSEQAPCGELAGSIESALLRWEHDDGSPSAHLGA